IFVVLAVVVLVVPRPARLAGAATDGPEAIFRPPGIPPGFGTLIGFVAQKQGFFKKDGVDATGRPVDSGAPPAPCGAAGGIARPLSPTPLIINQLSSSDVKLVAIYGLENPDWLIGTTDPAIAGCKDIAGKQVGVESIGGARSLALKELIQTCGLTLENVE